jgi:hypothetical protein
MSLVQRVASGVNGSNLCHAGGIDCRNEGCIEGAIAYKGERARKHPAIDLIYIEGI